MSILKRLVIAIVLLTCGCGANEKILRSGNETPVPILGISEKEVPFSRDLEDIRTAGFTFVFILRRKDGAPLEPGDRAVIREQTAETNRRVVADDGRAVIIGTNFQVPEKNMRILSGRFTVEGDFAAATDHRANGNTNAVTDTGRGANRKK